MYGNKDSERMGGWGVAVGQRRVRFDHNGCSACIALTSQAQELPYGWFPDAVEMAGKVSESYEIHT